MESKKRPYIKRFKKALIAEKDFLIKELQEESDRIERGAKPDQLVQRSKNIAVMMTKTVLALLAAGGALTIMAVAPNLFAGVGQLIRRKTFFEKDEFKKAAAYLVRKKFVTLKRTSYGYRMQVTDRGRDRILVLSYDNLKIKKMNPWDRTWRVVLFDIPNKQRWAREALREKLKEMQFFRLQKSVFVTPYPCKREVKFLTGLFNIVQHVRIIETVSLGDEFEIRRHFLL